MNGMNGVNMGCEACGTGFYSAAAHLLLAAGERCDTCGGALEARAGAAEPAPPVPLAVVPLAA